MKKIAVFGGLGFIGSYLVDILVEQGHAVHVFDLMSIDSSRFKSTNVSTISDEALKNELQSIDVIIDLVYATNPKTSFDDPVSDILKNLPNTVRLLNMVKDMPKLRNFIYVSSGGTVYGNTKADKIKEDHITDPISPYGITKLAIEKYGMMFQKINGLPFTVVRPANAYGIGQKANTGQGFISACINAIIKGNFISIYGNKGTVRDYIYVSDIASAIANLVEFDGEGKTYNVGTGIGSDNMDIINLLKPLAASANREVFIKHLNKRKFDVQYNVLDTTRISEETGWKPKVNLSEGLEMTWKNSL